MCYTQFRMSQILSDNSIPFSFDKNQINKTKTMKMKIDHLQKALDEASIYLVENYDKKGIKYICL